MNGGGQIGSTSCLFPGRDERRAWEDFLTSALAEALERVSDGAVGPDLDLASLQQELDDFDFQTPQALSSLLPWVIDKLEHGVVHMTHRRYFGLFNPSPSFPAECAERIVAAFNPQLASATTSPAAVAIEAHLIRAVGRRAGFADDCAGHFTTGGSEANFTALICALTRADPRYGLDGIRAFAGPPVVYVSEDAHTAWLKIAHQAGIGRSGLRLVGMDGAGRMDLGALRDAIAADRALGRVPVMVAGTAGTTGAGMVDPLAGCAAISQEAGAWFHVDAAWGGALIASDRAAAAIAGIELADSATIDAHKWFATTMACGMFLTRHADILPKAFYAMAAFMPPNAGQADPYVTTVQWSRRFLGLRLFVSLAAAGWSGFAEHVERSIRLTELLRTEMIARGWSTANESPLGVLCLHPPPGYPDARSIVRRVVVSNRAWIACATIRGREVVRVCVTNGQTRAADILALADLLQEQADTKMLDFDEPHSAVQKGPGNDDARRL
jgi:aromatic-L-amino-acid decarboxylase